MTLPDCPFCQEATLRAERAEPRGIRVCVCAPCGKRMRVDAEGHVIAVAEGYAVPRTDAGPQHGESRQ